MKVLILGATGFIGNPAAKAFVAAGHIVYGQTRSSSGSKALAAEEITPVVGDPSAADVERWLEPAVKEVDVVIDAIGGSEIRNLGPKLFELIKGFAAKQRPQGPPLTYIYCGGTWVHGDDTTSIVSELTPVTSGVQLTSWRIPHERAVVFAARADSPSLQALVIRPGLLYGRSGSILGSLFRSASEGVAKWPGEAGKGARTSVVHQDDLARAFVLAAEKAPLANGLIFDVTESTSVGIDDLLHELVRVSGAKGFEYTSPSENLFMTAVGSSQRVRPTLAKSILGWQPTRVPLIDGLEIYYNAWKASQ